MSNEEEEEDKVNLPTSEEKKNSERKTFRQFLDNTVKMQLQLSKRTGYLQGYRDGLKSLDEIFKLLKDMNASMAEMRFRIEKLDPNPMREGK